jgi:hypothetical protein
MDKDAARARAEVTRLEHELERARGKVRRTVQHCDHEWAKPKYTPDVREGHYARNLHGPIRDGQPVLPDVYIPREESPKWTRVCRKCGHTETTAETNEHVTRTPRF